MRFSEIPYQRPDIENLKEQFQQLFQNFSNAENAEEQIRISEQINNLRKDYHTQRMIAHIRFTQDTNNEYYQNERDFFNKNHPIFEGLENEMQRVFLNSPYRKDLESYYGEHLFNLFETHVNTHSEEIEEDLQKENELANEYTKLKAKAKIPFRGEEYNLTALGRFASDPDRETREEAYRAKYKFMEEHKEQLDDIYDRLVKTRHNIARKLGYENFIPLAYARLQRTDYGPEDVAKFRQSVENLIVPLATKLRKKQAKWLGLDKLKYYDESLQFPSGNPTPKGDRKWVLENAKEMYSELSPETEEFFNFLLEREYMDLENRDGKAGGGYCTFLPNYQAPFIFSNFNGTAGDVRVLTHEVGHAFQFYLSMDTPIIEYMVPTFDAAEIHSMTMEFLTFPWMQNFFKDEEEKYFYSQISSFILNLPYRVAVDEFQHYVYENPHASPEMRNKKWKELEKRYLPHRDYDGENYLEEGRFWQNQRHIYASPFYYIDYALADVCATQFWVRSRENFSQTLDDYLTLCKKGGSRPFTELVQQSNLSSPFREDSLEKVTEEIQKWLKNMDEEKVR